MSQSGYVSFYIDHGTEVATCLAQDFRDGMNERDRLRTENQRLRAALRQIQQWDSLNPPADHSDFPWLRRLVDQALQDP